PSDPDRGWSDRPADDDRWSRPPDPGDAERPVSPPHGSPDETSDEVPDETPRDEPGAPSTPRHTVPPVVAVPPDPGRAPPAPAVEPEPPADAPAPPVGEPAAVPGAVTQSPTAAEPTRGDAKAGTRAA